MHGANTQTNTKKPFIEHIHELQRRLLWCVLFAGIGGVIAYTLYEPILALVQKPLGQTLYYTSPTGGFSFMFKICLTAGFIFALPVALYHIFGFLGPLLRKKQRGTIVIYTIWSYLLAAAGITFAYIISLPAALHFLAKFGGDSVQALITADEYFGFALAYLGGFALLFQIPLLMLFINRMNRLKPGKLMGAQRYVILFSFIVAAILTPTPDPMNQLLMAAPAIVMYQVGIVLVVLTNRKKGPSTKFATEKMLTNDVFDDIMMSPESPIRKPEPMTQPTMMVSQRRVSRKFIDIIPPQIDTHQTLRLDRAEQKV